MKSRFLLAVGIVVFSLSHTYGQEFKGAYFPSLISSLKFPAPIEFCGEAVPIEIQDIRERFEKELLLALWDRPQVILWLKRSSRYLPYIERMLREGGAPEDLKYIAVAESALRPHVASRKEAIGFWQFLSDAGRQYGLTINKDIDERRNLFASTRAAIRYLKDLHEAMGSWTLAAAAYNMGKEAVKAEILEQGTDDFYHLYLPIETQRFIFRILSVKLILSNPANYGFHLSEEDYYPVLEFDRITLTCLEDTPIRIIAQAASTHFKAIKDLNPEVRGHYLTRGSHTILIPKGSANVFYQRYQDLSKDWSASKKQDIYIVREGDCLSSIADRFSVPLVSLLIWNKLNLHSAIYPGDRLIIHRNEMRATAEDRMLLEEGEESP